MIEVIDLSSVNVLTQPALSNEQAVEEAKELPKIPVSSATGNDQVQILKHDLADAFVDPQDNGKRYPAGVELAISNASETTIATAAFEALFYDDEGNVLEAVKHKEVDLQPNKSRAIVISSQQYAPGLVKSYDVKLVRIKTTNAEKVQPRKHDLSTNQAGEQELHGIVKNISEVKTDAAVVVTFYDADNEIIGTKVVLLKDIEPDAIRQYELRFKPQAGDTVANFSVVIGEMAE